MKQSKKFGFFIKKTVPNLLVKKNIGRKTKKVQSDDKR